MRRMKITRITLALAAVAAIGVGGTSIASADDDGGRPDETEIRQLFDGWNAALKTGDAERVADLYASDAVLLPTLRNEPHDTRAEIVDYFEHFLAKQPVGRITHSDVNVLDKNSAIDQGTYAFRVTAPDGTESEVPARYTFVYEKDRRGNWHIVSHHSSKYPEG
jgi:uncharacterized protein (TIGR02246 family)